MKSIENVAITSQYAYTTSFSQRPMRYNMMKCVYIIVYDKNYLVVINTVTLTSTKQIS